MSKIDYSPESSKSMAFEGGRNDMNKYSLDQDKKYFDSLKEAKNSQNRNMNNGGYSEDMEDSSDYSAMFMTF